MPRTSACADRVTQTIQATTERILVGHFLTRREAAHRAGIAPDEIVHRPDLLRIGGIWLEEVYFEFQFDRAGIRKGLGGVVHDLKRNFDDLTIADWLARPNTVLTGSSPLRWIASGKTTGPLAKAAADAGPRGEPRIKSREPRHLDS